MLSLHTRAASATVTPMQREQRQIDTTGHDKLVYERPLPRAQSRDGLTEEEIKIVEGAG